MTSVFASPATRPSWLPAGEARLPTFARLRLAARFACGVPGPPTCAGRKPASLSSCIPGGALAAALIALAAALTGTVASPASGQAADPPATASDARPPSAPAAPPSPPAPSEPSAPPAASPPATAPEPDAPAKKKPPARFVPSEEVSPDNDVPYPVDI
jgi:hypothetical protein